MRGIPNGFPNQQQMQNRSVSSRIPPSGKMGTIHTPQLVEQYKESVCMLMFVDEL